MQWLLLVAGIALVAAGAVDDPSFRWGEYAFAEVRAASTFYASLTRPCDCPRPPPQCRKLVRASGKRDVKRGFCERVQEAFENYIEGTGNQLAEAMGVSFSGQLGPRLFSQPYKAQGEQGVRTWLTKAIASGLYTNEDITTVR